MTAHKNLPTSYRRILIQRKIGKVSISHAVADKFSMAIYLLFWRFGKPNLTFTLDKTIFLLMKSFHINVTLTGNN